MCPSGLCFQGTLWTLPSQWLPPATGAALLAALECLLLLDSSHVAGRMQMVAVLAGLVAAVAPQLQPTTLQTTSTAVNEHLG